MTEATTAPVWTSPPPLPVLPGDLDTTLCVVGLGGSGLSAVLAACARGLDVVGIDAAGIAAGAAGRNGGFLLAGLAPFHHRAVVALGRAGAVAAYKATLAELAGLARDREVGAHFAGSVRVAGGDDESEDIAAMLTALRADSLPAEPYDGPEGRGVLLPTDGVCDPGWRASVLARRALAQGARLFGATRATDVRPGRVTTPRGSIRCDAVVVAVDGGLETILPELAGRVRTARLQMLATGPALDVTLPRPVYMRYGYDYWQQLPDRRIVLGGGRDVGGRSEWTAQTVPSQPVQQHLERLLREQVGTRAPITHRWAGAVAYTDDMLPVVETVRPGVVACGAYCGTGNVVGALCGRDAVQLATGEPAPFAALFTRA